MAHARGGGRDGGGEARRGGEGEARVRHAACLRGERTERGRGRGKSREARPRGGGNGGGGEGERGGSRGGRGWGRRGGGVGGVSLVLVVEGGTKGRAGLR
jgi:hypothetical protein